MWTDILLNSCAVIKCEVTVKWYMFWIVFGFVFFIVPLKMFQDLDHAIFQIQCKRCHYLTRSEAGGAEVPDSSLDHSSWKTTRSRTASVSWTKTLLSHLLWLLLWLRITTKHENWPCCLVVPSSLALTSSDPPWMGHQSVTDSIHVWIMFDGCATDKTTEGFIIRSIPRSRWQPL